MGGAPRSPAPRNHFLVWKKGEKGKTGKKGKRFVKFTFIKVSHKNLGNYFKFAFMALCLFSFFLFQIKYFINKLAASPLASRGFAPRGN